MGVISAAVERLLHTTANAGRGAADEARELHGRTPVVDLVVGSALFRGSFVEPGHGHVDLPRLRAGGVNVIGMTIATRFPDLRGTLSQHHFGSLGAPPAALRSNIALAEWLIGRIEGWIETSRGGLRLLLTAGDLQSCLAPDGPIGVFLSVQGGHVLDGDLANIARLRERGVRMLAPAHVMDNAMVGSGTGRRGGGLTPFGREAVAELERQRVLVDLAHMSLAGIEQTLPLLRRPPVLSHTGLVACNGRRSTWRRYGPATRNVPDWVVRSVADAGGVTGLTLSSWLLGGESLAHAVRVFEHATALAGPTGVGIGSDMDGGLRMVVDAAGLPLVTERMLEVGMATETVEAIIGGNALRLLADATAAG